MCTELISQEKYLEKPNCCPSKACQSTDIDGGSITVEGQTAWQKVSCNECDAVWNDVFTLTSYEVTEQPEAKSSNMKYYQNKRGYMLCTELPVDTNKLKGIVVIDNIKQAEEAFRANNGLDEDDGVFIPSIIEKDGQLYGQGLNTCFGEVDKTVEDYISQYSL